MKRNPHLVGAQKNSPHVFSNTLKNNNNNNNNNNSNNINNDNNNKSYPSSSSQQNTLKALINGQITGKSFRSIRHLGQGFFSHMSKQFNSLATLVVELEEAVTRQDGSKCKNCLQNLSKRLSEVTSTFFNENRDWFIELHGPEILVRILEFPPPAYLRSVSHPPSARPRVHSPQKRPRSPAETTTTHGFSSYYALRPEAHADQYAWKTRNPCLAILRELVFTHPQVGEWLGADDKFIVFLFSLLSDSKTFDAAIGLIEEVLGAKEETFDLSLVPNFNALVRGMTKEQLGIFCRVLAMVVFEPDDRNADEIVSSLELLRSRKRGRCVTPAVRNIDRNHAIVLGIPGLLERLVKLLRGTHHNPESHINFPTVNDLLAIHYYQATQRQDDGEGAGTSEGVDEEEGIDDGEGEIADMGNVLHSVEQELEALMDGTAQTLKALALSTYQVELLFVLYALLSGKRKAELQDRLASLGLVKTATSLFDKTDWLKPPTPLAAHERAIHGPQCECNPDAALKIQLLRLILNFCDGDFENRHNKRLLLSAEELASLQGAGSSSKETPGLLSKVISMFYKLPQDQNNRFWMASCIEAFLRGSDPLFQKFVARSGMLGYLIKDIISDETKPQGCMQTSFDLLGELMKFNKEIIHDFNTLLTGDKIAKFFNIVITHLVDSNVFLRGMILSMERFSDEDCAKAGTPDFTPYPFATCKISQFLDQNWFRLLKDLMTVVSIDNVNQENICCVNTTMVFCIYAKRKGQLRTVIQNIREEEDSYRTEHSGKQVHPLSVSANFQKLLWFWHEYYLLRGKDCLSLEYTSQIPFVEWTRTYEVLVEELGEFDPSSLYEAWREREQKHKTNNTTTKS